MKTMTGPGPYSVEVSRQPAMPVVYIKTNFGLVVRYEADMEFFFLGCSECSGRLETIVGHISPVCRDCKLEHEQYVNAILIMPGEAHLDPILRTWAQDYLDSFELVVTVDALARRLKKIHKGLRKEQNARYKPYDAIGRKYSGLLEPA